MNTSNIDSENMSKIDRFTKLSDKISQMQVN